MIYYICEQSRPKKLSITWFLNGWRSIGGTEGVKYVERNDECVAVVVCTWKVGTRSICNIVVELDR